MVVQKIKVGLGVENRKSWEPYVGEELILRENVDGLGDVYEIVSTWDKNVRALSERGLLPITNRDLAFARIKGGRDSYFCQNGSLTNENIIHVPGKYNLLTRDSPLIESLHAEVVVSAYRRGQNPTKTFFDSTPYEEQAEADKSKDPKDRRVLIVDNRHFNQLASYIEIPTDVFAESDEACWLYQDQRQELMHLLRKHEITEIPFRVPSRIESKKSLIFKLWTDSIGLRFGLSPRDIHRKERVFGL
jgi:hypothetical protein